jgi:cysteinyl-tRNA synthetase
MSIRFYNTLTRKKETFVPIRKNEVSLYTCGPTVYSTAHIGNFRTFLFEDMLKKYLHLRGYSVKHVMNLTDVDDRTIKRSIEKNVPLDILTEKHIKKFFTDLKTLKMSPADFYPRATRHIDIMIDLISQLIAKKNAYVTDDGSVYFNIGSYKNYGNLIRLDLSGQQKTDRVVSDHYSKDDPQDFALWKSWKKEDGDIGWDSPWGRGRPGWHIECSAMAMKYLGQRFDIHCGGVDNIFPHHENEIAQSECVTGKPFVNIWMHSEHLMIEKDKMSKSLDNFYIIDELIKSGYSSEAIRYILLSAHYRTKVSFSRKKRQEAAKTIARITDFSNRIDKLIEGQTTISELPKEYVDFEKAMDDDLDSPRAIAAFFDWMRKVNYAIDKNGLSIKAALKARNYLNNFNIVFGILPPEYVIPQNVQTLVSKREAARKANDWEVADDLRQQIYELGWIVGDLANGSHCKPIID